MSSDQDLQRQLDAQEEREARSAAMSRSSEMAREAFTEHLKNPEFLDKLQDHGLDNSLIFDWIEDELGPLVSGANIIGNRRAEYEHKTEWLNLNEVERVITERQPGRHLRENDAMLAVSQKAHKTDRDRRRPYLSDERRVIRQTGDIVTNMQSMRKNGQGVESVTTATAEQRTVKTEAEDSQSLSEKAAGLLD